MALAEEQALGVLQQAAIPLADPAAGERLGHMAEGRQLVLLGEASHGTDDFYAHRADFTRRLIEEQGFSAVAIEADWPDAWRVNEYVHGRSDDADADEALSGFRRYPTWMWRNERMLDFVEWLRDYNDGRPLHEQAGLYGLDVYSLYSSIDAVIDYLDDVDPAAAGRARERYACFDRYDRDSQAYGYATTAGYGEPCEDATVAQLIELQRITADRVLAGAREGGDAEGDAAFYAQQNARVVVNAERYYRSMFRADQSSWNIRDRHMSDVLDELLRHLERCIEWPRAVVWAHNSHLGNAAATEMGMRGELNLGQLVRDRHGEEALLVGYSTFEGDVTASHDWGGDARRMRVRPALPGSYERLFHELGEGDFLLPLARSAAARRALSGRMLERAIGVIYRPATERMSHYFQAELTAQFDAMVHFDTTSAVQPLECTQRWIAGEAPETFPSGY